MRNIKKQQDAIELDLKGSKTVWALSFSFFLLFSINSSSVYAQSSSESINLSEWTTYTGESILTDPIAQKILENIEISKQRIAELQNPQRIMTEQQKFIEEQRKIVQQKLQEELDRMEKSHANKTPRAAFEKMVAKYPKQYHDYLWELFDYLYSKVTTAREYRDNFLAPIPTIRICGRKVFISFTIARFSELFASTLKKP